MATLITLDIFQYGLAAVEAVHVSKLCITLIYGPSRGARDVKNYTGYVNFFKNFRLTPPPKNGQIHPKKGTVSPKMEFFPLPHAVGFTD